MGNESVTAGLAAARRSVDPREIHGVVRELNGTRAWIIGTHL
jgi:hypothetical protein